MYVYIRDNVHTIALINCTISVFLCVTEIFDGVKLYKVIGSFI